MQNVPFSNAILHKPLLYSLDSRVRWLEGLNDIFRRPVLAIVLRLGVRDIHEPLRRLVEVVLLQADTHRQLERPVRPASFLESNLHLAGPLLMHDVRVRNRQGSRKAAQP